MTQILALLIPILAIGLGIGTGMLAIYLNYRKRKEMFALHHQERMAAIEKGIELPPLAEAFFYDSGGKPAPSPHGTFLSGLVLVSVGLTLYIALHYTGLNNRDGNDRALFALIPGGVGVALLIYYVTVGRKLAAAMEAERKEPPADPGAEPEASSLPPRTPVTRT